MTRTYRVRAAWGSWIWFVISSAYVVATVVSAARLPDSVWVAVPSKFQSTYLYAPVAVVIQVGGWVLVVQLLLATFATVNAALTPRDNGPTAWERIRRVMSPIAIVLFIPTFVASFFGAEALLSSIPLQLDHAPVTYEAALSTLGLFSSPIASTINVAGIVAAVAALAVSRINTRRRTKALARQRDEAA
jgi:hypothetical protein